MGCKPVKQYQRQTLVYLMLLSDEISKSESILLQKCGVNERLFYFFLLEKQDNNSQLIGDGDIDKVCFSAFTNSGVDVSKEIQRNINAQPIRGMHFSNNIISLIAFTLKSAEAKGRYLRPYFTSATLSHQFLIAQVFPEMRYSSAPQNQSIFDKLVDEIRKKYG